MHATVNRQACIRCGLCPSLCPEVFTLPEGADSAMLFFADSAFRPIGTAKPVTW